MIYDITIADKNYRLELGRQDDAWQCRLDGREIQMDAVLSPTGCAVHPHSGQIV